MTHNRKGRPGLLAFSMAIALGVAMPALAQGISNGIATVTGHEAGGDPQITYGPGATPGVSSGIFNPLGTSDGSARNIPGPGAHGSFADGGIPVYVPGHGADGSVVYLEPPAAAVLPSSAVPLATPARHPLPQAAAEALQKARGAIARGHADAAGMALEEAETALLNARRDGAQGWSRSLAILSSARQELARHDLPAAGSALEALARRA